MLCTPTLRSYVRKPSKRWLERSYLEFMRPDTEVHCFSVPLARPVYCRLKRELLRWDIYAPFNWNITVLMTNDMTRTLCSCQVEREKVIVSCLRAQSLSPSMADTTIKKILYEAFSIRTQASILSGNWSLCMSFLLPHRATRKIQMTQEKNYLEELTRSFYKTFIQGICVFRLVSSVAKNGRNCHKTW